MNGNMANEEIKEKLDQFHYHEALDRIYVISQNCDEHLLQHPAIKLESEVKENIEKAILYLCEAYQQIGNIIDDRFEDE